ncbi:hypothetical protein V6N13_069344 [Hibiscus sabdariffa]|uniref:Uncharacterized protein n=1 Tax=Hibiscus sabdariffa TaxID=183260 RepID=A0ABR2PG30_9ROSI
MLVFEYVIYTLEDRKWQKIAAIGRHIISSVRIDKENLAAASCSNESSAVDKRLLCYLHIGWETFCDPLGVSRQHHLFVGLATHQEVNFRLLYDAIEIASMVSTKKLIEMARKWRKIAAIGRKRITSPRSSTYRETAKAGCSNISSVVDKAILLSIQCIRIIL